MLFCSPRGTACSTEEAAEGEDAIRFLYTVLLLVSRLTYLSGPLPCFYSKIRAFRAAMAQKCWMGIQGWNSVLAYAALIRGEKER